MILAAVDLLKRNPEPNEDDIRNGRAGNLCRCTGYTQMYQAISTQADAIHQLFVSTLGTSATSYAVTEAANAMTAG